MAISTLELDALALEYKRVNGTARGDLNVFNLVNNPTANSICRVLRLGLSEQSSHGVSSNLGTLDDNVTDALLATQHVVHVLPK